MYEVQLDVVWTLPGLDNVLSRTASKRAVIFKEWNLCLKFLLIVTGCSSGVRLMDEVLGMKFPLKSVQVQSGTYQCHCWMKLSESLINGNLGRMKQWDAVSRD